jgi:16S rRNA (guanine527-N7)-methyltransferase
MDFAEYLQQAAVDYGIALSIQQQQQFELYYQLLIEWNKKINLTAITAPQDVAVKHIIDSLACYDVHLFAAEATVIDVGSGAGFPGIPLKIFRPDLRVTLLDSVNKRLIYLQEVVDKLKLSQVRLVHSRAEDAAQDKQFREKFSIATARAVARLTVLAELCLPFVSVGGHFLALKGKDALLEVSTAQQGIKLLGGMVSEIRSVALPGISDERSIVVINKQQSSPIAYPRRPGSIEKNPL